jgi:archaellum component FlaF (FlaF/FlaG flagellin family)
VEPSLTPGKVYVDSVTVTNYTSAPLTFNLYGADAVNTAGDGLSLRRRTDVQIAMGRWIKLPYARLTVPAQRETVVPFSILPPPHTVSGEYLGGIVAEDTQGTTSRRGTVPITIIQAVGVRIYGRVAGPLHPKIALSHLSMNVTNSLAAQFGGSVDARVKFTVQNLGNTILSPATSVVLTTPFGTAVRRTFTINELLPGNSLEYSLAFPGVSAYGHLRAEVSIRGDGVNATAVTTAWVLPWVLIVIILVALVALAAFVVRARRRRRKRRIESATGPGPAPTSGEGAAAPQVDSRNGAEEEMAEPLLGREE